MDCFLKRVSLFFVTIAMCSAEVFTLKTGETLEGKILENTVDSYKILYQFSPSIQYEKVLKKEDIVRISQSEKSGEDQEAFEKLRQLVPVPDGKEAAYYEKVIQTALLPFQKQFPNSSYQEEVDEMISTLRQEQEKIEAGSLKIGGTLLSTAQIEADAYHLYAQKYGAEVAQGLKENKWLPTLRSFQKLHDDYRYSEAYRQHREPILKKLSAYLALLEKKEEEAENGPSKALLEKLSARERSLYLEKNEERKAALESRRARELQRGEVWLTTDFSDPSDLSKTIRQAEKFVREIEKTRGSEADAGALYRELKTLLKGSDHKETKTVAQAFLRLSPPDELREEISAQLRDQNLRAKELQKKAREDKAAERKRIAIEKREARKAEREAQKKESE